MLGIIPQPARGELVCKLVCDESDGGAPEVYFSCSLLEDGESYAFELREWAELLLCEVNSNCIEKYGGLVVAAEILHEMTFYGYRQEDVRQKKEEIDEIINDPNRRNESIKLSEVVRLSEEGGDEERYKFVQNECAGENECKNWFSQAPDDVKRVFLERIKQELYGWDRCDTVTDDELLGLLKSEVENSGYRYKNYSSVTGIIDCLAQNLDCDDMHYLLTDVLGIE